MQCKSNKYANVYFENKLAYANCRFRKLRIW